MQRDDKNVSEKGIDLGNSVDGKTENQTFFLETHLIFVHFQSKIFTSSGVAFTSISTK